MALPYKLIDFAKSLDIGRCKIQHTPDLLFLCGGPTSATGPYRSVRDFFFRYLQGNRPTLAERVRLAESIDEWFQRDRDSTFSDLLELENYLANLAAMTVLFVESEGAIAELGAFAASAELCPKTLAVLNERFSTDRSFIAHGPLRRIRNVNKKHVHVYPWDFKDFNSDPAKEMLGGISSEIADAIELEDKHRPKRALFKDIPGHTLLLVADLVRLAGVAEDSDIAHCLRAVGCDDARKYLARHLLILESVGLVVKRQRGAATFYAGNSTDRLISYTFKKDAAQTDIARIQLLLRDSLGKRQKSIIKDSLRKATPHV